MKKIVLKTLGIILIGVFLLQSNLVMAASSLNDVDEQINEKKEEIEGIQTEKSETMSEVEDLTIQISEYQSQIDDLDSQIDELNTKIQESEKEIEEAQSKYDEQKELLDTRLVVAYEQGETSYLDVLLSSENIVDFISNYFYISELATSDTELMDSLQKEKEEIEQAKTDLENSKRELDTSKAEKQSITTQLQTSKNEKNAKVSQLSSDEKQAQKELEQFEADKRAIQAELARIAAEEEAKRKQESNGGNGGSATVPSNPSSSGYIFPVAGLSRANINNKSYPSYKGHTGVDVNINVTGKSVVAVKSGTVVISKALTNSDGSYRSYGEYVVINHHDGTMTLYAHMLSGSRRVKEGQSVSQGQVIGTVGSTGNSSGNHLHFEVLVNGKPQNPFLYLP